MMAEPLSRGHKAREGVCPGDGQLPGKPAHSGHERDREHSGLSALLQITTQQAAQKQDICFSHFQAMSLRGEIRARWALTPRAGSILRTQSPPRGAASCQAYSGLGLITV